MRFSTIFSSFHFSNMYFQRQKSNEIKVHLNVWKAHFHSCESWHSSVHSVIRWSPASEQWDRRRAWVPPMGLLGGRGGVRAHIYIYTEMTFSVANPPDCVCSRRGNSKYMLMYTQVIVWGKVEEYDLDFDHILLQCLRGSGGSEFTPEGCIFPSCSAQSASRPRLASEESRDLSYKNDCEWHAVWKSPLSFTCGDLVCMIDGQKHWNLIWDSPSELCPHESRYMVFITLQHWEQKYKYFKSQGKPCSRKSQTTLVQAHSNAQTFLLNSFLFYNNGFEIFIETVYLLIKSTLNLY